MSGAPLDVVVGAPLAVMLLVSAAPAPPDYRNIRGLLADAPSGGALDLVGDWSGRQAGDERGRPSGSGVSTATEWESMFAEACLAVDDTWHPGPCEFIISRGEALCAEGETPRPPRWRRFRIPPSTTWSEWELADYGSCAGAPVVPVLTAEDFRRLPLPAPVLHVQPEGDWVLTNIETIVYTDPAPVTLTTELLGVAVTVEATPSQFTYDWGDGHSTRTRDPGRPYPAFDVVHEYEAPGQVAITLTTRWTGRYRVAGDPQWRDVAGTATTIATSAPFAVEERTSRLVSGTCAEQPDAPGCEGWHPSEARG